jgi:hypothetical protein
VIFEVSPEAAEPDELRQRVAALEGTLAAMQRRLDTVGPDRRLQAPPSACPIAATVVAGLLAIPTCVAFTS